MPRLLNSTDLSCKQQKPLMTTDKDLPIQKVARPPVNTPDSCHRNSLENFNISVFGNIQTLTRVFLPETDMCLSQRNLGAPPVARGPQSRRWTMKITYLLAALLLVESLATPTRAQERTHNSVTRAQTYGIAGREIAAPPWSAACMTDHGPSECGEPMWIYGSSDAHARYRNAF
jgi:hypothetical protein